MGYIVKSDGKKASAQSSIAPPYKMNVKRASTGPDVSAYKMNVKKTGTNPEMTPYRMKKEANTNTMRTTSKSNDVYQSKSYETSKSIKSATPAPTTRIISQKPGPVSLQNRIALGRKRQQRRQDDEEESSDVQYLVEEGPLSFRAIALVGGFFMILASILDLIDGEDENYSLFKGIISTFIDVCGFIIVTLEGRPFHIQIPFVYNFLVRLIPPFNFTWGRGFFYFTVGCLQFFLFTKYDMVSGVIFMLLGIASIIAGYKASVRLAGLRNSLATRSDVKYLFHSFDKDNDGYINLEEFRDLMRTMDQEVQYNDFVAALSSIDVENNQRISLEDLETWYLEYSESELPPALGCCTGSRYDQRHRNLNPNAQRLA